MHEKHLHRFPANDHCGLGKQHSIPYLCIAAFLTGALALFGLSGCTSTEQSGGSQGAQNPPSGQQGGTTRIAEGIEAPDFEFATADGKTAKLSDYRGKVVLLNFWSTWCGYCIHEMPAMQQIADDYDDVAILAINRGDTVPDAMSFAEDSGYGFVWGLDEDQAIADLYPSSGVPYSVIIDKDGTVSTIFEGSSADMHPHFERAVTAAGAQR